MGMRRGRDEGSIYQRSDGRWAASVSLGYDEAGKRARKTIYGKTRKEVADKLRALQNAAEQGLPPENNAVTVGQLFDSWLAEAVKPSVRPRTYESYAMMARLHIVPMLGRHKLAKVDTRAVQAFLTARGEAGLSPRTVLYLRMILRRAFGQAVKWGWVARNVVDLTEPPKVERGETPRFSPEQARAMLAAFSTHRLGPLFTLHLGLGLRLGEALGLRWQDVALPEGGDTGGTITVRVQLQVIGGAFQLNPPKSASSRRTLALPAFVAAALTKQRDRQRDLAEKWEPRANAWGLVFTTDGGNPLHERNVRRDFKNLLEKAGIGRVRVHDLRHLCASLLVSQGVHPRVIMGILGHSQISLTMNTYSHLMPGSNRAAAETLDGVLGPGTSHGL
jgi:integrase